MKPAVQEALDARPVLHGSSFSQHGGVERRLVRPMEPWSLLLNINRSTIFLLSDIQLTSETTSALTSMFTYNVIKKYREAEKTHAQ